MTEPLPGAGKPAGGIEMTPRRPVRALLCSALLPGAGQIHNRQLEKAVLLWIWMALAAAAGALLLLMGLLDRLLPPAAARPPLASWVGDHGAPLAAAWAAAFALLWLGGAADAFLSARRINRGEVVIRYRLRRQLVHLLASQLLGLIPVAGFLFPPGVVAEAMDAVAGRRGPDARRLLHEGRQALLEWTLTRAAVYLLALLTAVWLLAWVVAAARG